MTRFSLIEDQETREKGAIRFSKGRSKGSSKSRFLRCAAE